MNCKNRLYLNILLNAVLWMALTSTSMYAFPPETDEPDPSNNTISVILPPSSLDEADFEFISSEIPLEAQEDAKNNFITVVSWENTIVELPDKVPLKKFTPENIPGEDTVFIFVSRKLHSAPPPLAQEKDQEIKETIAYYAGLATVSLLISPAVLPLFGASKVPFFEANIIRPVVRTLGLQLTVSTVSRIFNRRPLPPSIRHSYEYGERACNAASRAFYYALSPFTKIGNSLVNLAKSTPKSPSEASTNAGSPPPLADETKS